MHVEQCCQALLAHVLPKADEDRSGLAIDIGVGTFAFYCQLFAQLGFPTIAVEPLPNKKLIKLCRSHDIRLIESCISDVDGFVNLYIGSFNGEKNLNLNSMRPDWWGSTAVAKRVRSKSLSNLLIDIGAADIACVKLDVEGMEPLIIRQLLELEEVLLPKVLMFEYGGGATRESGRGAWSEELLDGTMKSLEIIRDLGYEQAIVIDSAADTEERVLALKSTALEPAAVFPPQSVYGNVVALRGVQFLESEVSSICRPYRDNESVPPPPKVPGSVLERISRKVRQTLYR